MYLYVFRNKATYERLRSTIDACARSYVTDAATFESVEESPFVLAGQGPWAPEFKTAHPDRDRVGGRHRRLADPDAAQTTRSPRILRAMTRRWTWLVPSPISVSLASRR